MMCDMHLGMAPLIRSRLYLSRRKGSPLSQKGRPMAEQMPKKKGRGALAEREKGST